MNLSGLRAEQKPLPGITDDEYVKWVNAIPSCLDGSMDRTYYGWRCDGHHIKTKGSGGGDYWRVPVTRAQHQLCHQKGNKFVEKKFGIDFHAVICKLLASKFGIEIPRDVDSHEDRARIMIGQAEKMYRERNNE